MKWNVILIADYNMRSDIVKIILKSITLHCYHIEQL